MSFPRCWRAWHQGHGGPWDGKLDTSRSVRSEHHILVVPKGPEHLSWSLELEGEQLWWGTHREQCWGCCWQQMSLLDLLGATRQW